MSQVERLYRDHEQCRDALNALETALAGGEPMRWTVWRLCLAISTRLTEHAQQEYHLIASRERPLSARELCALADGHGEETDAFRLAAVQAHRRPPEALVESIRQTLSLAITWARFHMDEQEYKLFPALAWVLDVSPDADKLWTADHPASAARRVTEPRWSQAQTARLLEEASLVPARLSRTVRRGRLWNVTWPGDV